MCAHGDSYLHHCVHRLNPRCRRIEPKQRRQQCRAIGLAGGTLIHHLNLIALEHRNVDKLARFLATMMLHHQQARRGHFNHKAQNRNSTSGSPDAKLALVSPDPQVNSWALDRWRNPGKDARSKWQWPL